MNNLNDFLSKRIESDLYISVEEISAYCKNFDSEERKDFLILMRGHLKKILDDEDQTYESLQFYEAAYTEIFDWLKEEVEKLEEEIVEQKILIPDENKGSVDFTRKQTALLAHYFKEYRFIKKLDNRPLGKLLHELTEHSEGNIRRDLSHSSLESIIQEVDCEKIIKTLEVIIDKMKNRRL